MGRRLAVRLIGAGCQVRALVRSGSEGRLPSGVECLLGDALDPLSIEASIGSPDVFVHLVGVAHPSPAKAREFREVDLAGLKATVTALRRVRSRSGGGPHLVYVSVAQPAPIMREYVAVRRECEDLIRDSGISATILRPWYVLGPGHWWPIALEPFYWLAERFPATREGARRLGLVTITQMLNALEWSTMHPSTAGVRVLEVPAIRDRSYLRAAGASAGETAAGDGPEVATRGKRCVT